MKTNFDDKCFMIGSEDEPSDRLCAVGRLEEACRRTGANKNPYRIWHGTCSKQTNDNDLIKMSKYIIIRYYLHILIVFCLQLEYNVKNDPRANANWCKGLTPKDRMAIY